MPATHLHITTTVNDSDIPQCYTMKMIIVMKTQTMANWQYSYFRYHIPLAAADLLGLSTRRCVYTVWAMQTIYLPKAPILGAANIVVDPLAIRSLCNHTY